MYKHGDRHVVAALLLLTLAAMKEPATVLSSLERQRKGTSRRELRAERDSATPSASGGESEEPSSAARRAQRARRWALGGEKEK